MVRRYLSRRQAARCGQHRRAHPDGRLSSKPVGMTTPGDIGAIAREFQIEGQLAGVVPIGSGHIHDSYRVTFADERGSNEFVLQRINTRVFPRPAELMDNVVRITSHLVTSLAFESEAAGRALHLVPARSAEFACLDRDGSWWRIFEFIPGARAHEAV